uniref:Dynamin-type G domain-containing protein n=1 Tax=Steinernema glaseri TaxID=37863 RepID=A0A1I8AWQ4_9BILA
MSGTMSTMTAAGDNTRSAKAQRRGGEPLARFSEAKTHMGEIYSDLDGYVKDLSKFYNDFDYGHKFVPEKQIDEVAEFMESIKTIKEMFGRDSMKVVFFGRTSNGKSSVINAMLHAKVLPQGMGHTTSCFLQVEGGLENEKYLMFEDSEERIDFNEIHNVGHALSSENSDRPSMGQDALLRVIYPKNASRLLQNDVVLLDSPGVDLSPEFDGWIDKHCRDADVFVLVCNAEATLTQAEKSFFERVSRLLSRPNVFILNNRWDASASEIDQHVDQVRQQHLTRFRQFLVNELKVCSYAEAVERIFFVSAREMLDARLKEKKEIERAYQMDGHLRRQQEFLSFENQFERCISKSAIRTKFEAHLLRAREIVSNMRHNLEVVNNAALQERQKLVLDFELKNKEFGECRENFKTFENMYLDQQHSLRAEVHLKVSSDFHDEISRLEAIIDRFERRFTDEPPQIAVYKKLLAEHVEQCITSDLEARCTGGLMTRIWTLEQDMFRHIQEILRDPYTQKLEEIWKYRAPFKFSINVNCPTLMEDFQEDLEFRFSLGPSAIIRRIIAYRSGQPITAISAENSITRALSHGSSLSRSYTDVGPNGIPKQKSFHDFHSAPTNPVANNDQSHVISQLLLSSVSVAANGSVGLIIIGGLVYKSLGWRVIATGAAIYGGLYALERLRWNSSAKEQHLKDQFRSHLTTKMKHAAGMHTAHCENQVLREMEQVHEGLKATVAGAHREMKDHLDVLKNDVSKIDVVMKELSIIKGKTAFLNTSMDQFEANYLAPESPQ